MGEKTVFPTKNGFPESDFQKLLSPLKTRNTSSSKVWPLKKGMVPLTSVEHPQASPVTSVICWVNASMSLSTLMALHAPEN